MERDRFLDIKTKYTTLPITSVDSRDLLYLINEVERLRALLANYDDTYCRVWHIGDVNILGDK